MSVVLPHTNEAAWAERDATNDSYRGGDATGDDVLSVVHDGATILLNTSGRHTESNAFEEFAKYGLYVPRAAEEERYGRDAATLADGLVDDARVREILGVDRVKDPAALEGVLRDALRPFRTFSDVQVSARIGGPFWDSMGPLRDFVLSHNYDAGVVARRATQLPPLNRRELSTPSPAAEEEGEETDEARRCVVQ